ncbi:hypothetical protein [Paenisporosarcina antarctica]|uniref:Uncharacterized protein n=1 Tax=Paenisporosarcina antarctica TaxID=417367 RepID=A0A4P7A1S5_9BACL|nr:hypothetical protein [Paenisporosarcina antarctica]QBP42568.1 hypothetical protein E2636_16055 [Paenisporosarcina antarctica]
MKKTVWMAILILLVIVGISFLLFVVRMIWFPPSSMGMMMDHKIMFHHMSFWFGQMFWILLILLGIILLVSMMYLKKRNK